MPSVTRRAVFEPLVALAEARVVALVESHALAREDGRFLLRALIDLESDGPELFDGARAADDAFYADVRDYLVARAGAVAAEAPLLAPGAAEKLAVLAAEEGLRVSELLGLAGVPCGSKLDRAVTELITHQGGTA
jgi:hypothetical protein